MDVRPIDADALVAEQCGQCDGACEMFDEEKCLTCKADCHCDLREAIDNAPTLDLAPVRHGVTIHTSENGKFKRVFSCCGTDFTKLTMWMIPNYCPNCGAKMDGGEKDV